MSNNEKSSNPAPVVLIILSNDPNERTVTVDAENLPALPQVGHTLSVDIFERGFCYICQVMKVEFSMELRSGTTKCRTIEVQVECIVIRRESLT